MQQEVKIFWQWLQHDMLGKLLFNTAMVFMIWSKWALSRYIIYYWFGNKYNPTLWESLFDLPPKMDPRGMLIEIFLKILFILLITNYLRASFGDPGYVHLMRLKMPEDVLPEKLEKNCVPCNNMWKPPRAHHCKVCAKCVLRMDHHCAWIANCVGAKNQKFFILFLFYTVCYTLTGIGLCICNLILWLIEYGRDPKGNAIFKDGWGLGNRIALAIGGVFFLLFAFDFLWEQGEAVIQNQTTVETYKNMVGRPGSFMTNMKKVFGINKWAWMLPIAPKLKINTLELLYYDVEVTADRKGEASYVEDEFPDLPIFEKYYIR